jgi:hypothetical protein
MVGQLVDRLQDMETDDRQAGMEPGAGLPPLVHVAGHVVAGVVQVNPLSSMVM